MTETTAPDFHSLGLSDDLLDGLDHMNIRKPTPIQAQAIPAVLDGRDLIACAQTGTGKTAAFLLPLIDVITSYRPKVDGSIRGLVVVPTRELALQIDQQMQAISSLDQHRRYNDPGHFGEAAFNTFLPIYE